MDEVNLTPHTVELTLTDPITGNRHTRTLKCSGIDADQHFLAVRDADGLPIEAFATNTVLSYKMEYDMTDYDMDLVVRQSRAADRVQRMQTEDKIARIENLAETRPWIAEWAEHDRHHAQAHGPFSNIFERALREADEQAAPGGQYL